ncbi:hypothetical protein [Nocardioides sp. TF02-7]|uniref:hypothetical protein n=1 Tax=Nocardioides sp. TF02-7 TaxID=2917724 RepID=UPI001F06DAB4|nr:hypothetical protein [Nocardioides sp. TF02-7]UMG91806.1 hypothetical protein MF408_17380 [Nocardioides sp. TF02-7]
MRCTTSVGTDTDASTPRTSTAAFMSIRARTVVGVAAADIRRFHQRAIASSPERTRSRRSAAQSQRRTSSEVYAARSSSLCPHG